MVVYSNIHKADLNSNFKGFLDGLLKIEKFQYLCPKAEKVMKTLTTLRYKMGKKSEKRRRKKLNKKF